MIIVAKQNYNLTEDDLNNNLSICNMFSTCCSVLCGEEEYTYKRNIYIKMIKHLKIYYLVEDYVNIDNKKCLLYFLIFYNNN